MATSSLPCFPTTLTDVILTERAPTRTGAYCPALLACRLGFRSAAEAGIQGQRLGHDLIHVVVTIAAEPSDKRDIGQPIGEFPILPVKFGVFRAWNRVIG